MTAENNSASDTVTIAKQARNASLILQSATNDQKNTALKNIHRLLNERKDVILEGNRKDLQVGTTIEWMAVV